MAIVKFQQDPSEGPRGATKKKSEETKEQKLLPQRMLLRRVLPGAGASEGINADAIKAKVKDGVLNVVLPKKTADEVPTTKIRVE